MTLASEKGLSNWLNALPLKKYGFNKNKSEFRDRLRLRYHWDLERSPEHCACGEKRTIAHSLHCPKGGFTHLRHIGIRDSFGELLNQVCHDVEIEPKLLPLQGESFASNSVSKDDEARLDIKANGLWESRLHRTFFDVKVFNPHAKSCPKNTKDAYRYHESLKKLKYEKRIVEVEQSSFTPQIFSCTGGVSPITNEIITRIAQKSSHKREESFSDIVSYILTRLSFALLRSCLLCIGCKVLKKPELTESSIGAIIVEGRLK